MNDLADQVLRLDHLRDQSRALDPDQSDRTHINRLVLQHAESYLDSVTSSPAYHPEPTEIPALQAPFPETGHPLSDALDLLHEGVDHRGISTTSPRFFGYIPGGGLYYAAMGDLLAAVSNKYSGVFFASPGAVEVEEQCLAFLAKVAGYPAGYGGYLASGGSMANFTAVVTARDHHGVLDGDISRSVVYLTDHSHHCIDKALHLAGLSSCVVRRVPVDSSFRMQTDALETQLREDQTSGLVPFLIVASAGTTNTGSIDPLVPIGHLAREFGAWYHVDGAYGALFALSESGRKCLQGMELSDSIVMDPHKTLFLPYGVGALLVRDKKRLLAAHRAGADYMQDVIHTAATSPATLSPELTKHFRGLRMWLPLQVAGVAPFRAALEEKILLARYFHHRLSSVPGFEVGPVPDLSVVTYRFIPQFGDPDLFNERLVRAIHQDGRIFVSSTRLNGRFMLRLAVVCFRSHRQDVDVALEVLQELAHALDNDLAP